MSLPVTPQRLREWVEKAQPNARLTYHETTAHDVPHAAVMKAVRELYERGWLTPHYVGRRRGSPGQYLVQRTQRPFLKGTVL